VAVYRHGVELAARGERAHWVGGLQGYRLEQLLDVWRLRYGHRDQIRDPFLAGFEGYEALTAYAESQDQRDLKAWLGLLERHERCQEVPSLTDQSLQKHHQDWIEAFLVQQIRGHSY
jgi:hypothetical protein